MTKKKDKRIKYKKIFADKIIEYFSIEPFTTNKKVIKKGNFIQELEVKEPNRLPVLHKFAAEIGVSTRELLRWSQDKRKPEFSLAFMRAKELQKFFIAELASLGLYDSSFSKYMLSNISDWKDKQQVEHSADEGFTMVIHQPKPSKKKLPKPVKQIQEVKQIEEIKP